MSIRDIAGIGIWLRETNRGTGWISSFANTEADCSMHTAGEVDFKDASTAFDA
jgi:hypothetical protein